MPRVLCYRCGNRGHYSDHCPEAENSEEALATIDPKVQNHMDGAVIEENSDDGSDEDDVVIGFTHHTMERGRTQVDKDSVLLDTGSNCSVFNNAEFLTNIRKSERTLRAFTNGGSQDSTHIGYLDNFFDVWFNPNSMMNILSFSEVGKKYRITFDSATEKDIVVHGVNGKNLRFKEVSSGLYLLDNPKNIKHLIDNYSLFNLDRNIHVTFTKRQLKQAALAKQLYSNCNCPGYALFIRLLQNNYFRNSPITVEDVKRSLEVYGRDQSELKGKGTRTRPIPIQDMEIIPLPVNILEHNREIHLSVDYLYINGIAMLHSISGWSYQFRTLQPLFKNKANKTDILEGINSIIKIYKARGITIKQINGDNEFHCVKHDFLPSVFNIVASEEHVGDIEKSVRTIKDGTRVHISRLPFCKYPRAMVAGAAMHALISINQLPSNNGLSNILSPSTLITGESTPDFNNIIKLNFGDYVLTPPGKTKNDQSPRRIGAIALYPSKNASRGWYFMSLVTGQILHRYSWIKLPIADDMINAVHAIADKQMQKPITDNFTYKSESGINYDDPNELRSEDEVRSEDELRSEDMSVNKVPEIDTEVRDRNHSEVPTNEAEQEKPAETEEETWRETDANVIVEENEEIEQHLEGNEGGENGSISNGDQSENQFEEESQDDYQHQEINTRALHWNTITMKQMC